jgi:hypothetical protein
MKKNEYKDKADNKHNKLTENTNKEYFNKGVLYLTLILSISPLIEFSKFFSSFLNSVNNIGLLAQTEFFIFIISYILIIISLILLNKEKI